MIAGPYWYEGPLFQAQHALYQPKPFDPKGYSDAFFTWPEDFDGDGWVDLLYVGFPGQWAAWLRNPLADSATRESHWIRHEVLSTVDNESPAFIDLTGDGKRELVFHTGERFGWAGPDPKRPTDPWIFHPLSQEFALGPFVHGLGVGDVDGDGRADVLWRAGWLQQPSSIAGDPEWKFHPHAFTDREGGAQMFFDDVDGDGDGDVITSLAAHHFGLAWFEQIRRDGVIAFVEHRFMDDEPIDSPHGVRFGEVHALDLCDVDGDGTRDIVTGKRWWSHGAQGDHEPGSKPVVYWFQRVRTGNGVDWVPHPIDDDSGVGVVLTTGDVDHDGQRDVVVGNKRGVSVLAQRRSSGARAAGTIARTDVGAFVVRKIENLGDSALAARVTEVWGRVQATPAKKRARIDELKAQLTPAALVNADLPRGRDILARTCQQCHVLFERGGKVGPELTGSNRHDLEYLFSNAIDPSAVVAKDYWMTILALDDGRLVTGIVRSSTPSSITLRTENEDVVVACDEIEDSRVVETSLMPEGLLGTLAESDVRDLVAYLQSSMQVPRLATPENASSLFDGQTLTGWRGADCWSVTNGEIVGRTAGLARNEFLRSDLELRDFRLSLEVRLVDDAGNSGVQFRSRELEDGEMQGYQADIGPGWWGRLYEEHGRSLLSEKTGEEHVLKDGWNRYEIEARGHRVRTWINGHTCVDLEDAPGASGGIIGLQIHSGGATEVRFRDLKLEVFAAETSPR